MRIGIDCRMFGPQNSGLGRYVEQLVLGLGEIDEENEYVLFVRANTALTPLKGGVRTVTADMPWYSWQEQVKFKKIIDKEKVDLMHFPHWNVPFFYNKPFVVTVHDLIMYHYPRQEASTHGLIVYWFKDLMHRLVLRHAVKRAKKIIVTSEFTKQDVHQTLGVPLEKMIVTYQAPFNLITNNQDTNKFQISNFKFQIDKPFVLYVGNAYPHKNLEGLLKAWKIFCEKHSTDYQLVLVGKKNFFYEKLIKKTINQKNNKAIEQFNNLAIQQYNNIVFTDYVNDEYLSMLYENASLYVFPSLYEGFGLPPLEAQTFGVPVVSSSATCLPEILGESVLYFDPENYEQMAEVIYRGLTDENLRFELKKNASENLLRFSWEELVKKTLEIYRNC